MDANIIQNFGFIESGIIFGLDSFEKLKKFKYNSQHFYQHADAYKFVLNFVDKYSSFPTLDQLLVSFPGLDPSARDLKFD